MTDKQMARRRLEDMPDDSSLREIAGEIEVLAALREAEADMASGRVRPLEAVRPMVSEWSSKFSSPTAPSRI